MFTKLLARCVHPKHDRDYITIANVAKSLRVSIFMASMSSAALLMTKNRLVVMVNTVLLLVAVAHLVVILVLLHKEISLRNYYRMKRLALPSILADGVAAGERMDAERAAEIITIRLNEQNRFDNHSIKIFDCLMHDMLTASPKLSIDLADIARRKI